MPTPRPYALTIAGFDPSAGAGVLADVKALEANGVYGLAACTALTVQNDVAFERVRWVPLADIQDQIRVLLTRFRVDFIKLGLVESLPDLLGLIRWLKAQNPAVHLIWDPVLKATAGYEFHARPNPQLLAAICRELTLLTPNQPEALRLYPANTAQTAAAALAAWCPVLLKGGHADGGRGHRRAANRGRAAHIQRAAPAARREARQWLRTLGGRAGTAGAGRRPRRRLPGWQSLHHRLPG